MSIAYAPEVSRSFVPEFVSEADFGAQAAPTHDLPIAPEPQPVAVAPFGWYPDPAGSPMLRWWNGTAWTNRLELARPELQPAAGYSTKNLLTR